MKDFDNLLKCWRWYDKISIRVKNWQNFNVSWYQEIVIVDNVKFETIGFQWRINIYYKVKYIKEH